jgi:hypothetical protein
VQSGIRHDSTPEPYVFHVQKPFCDIQRNDCPDLELVSTVRVLIAEDIWILCSLDRIFYAHGGIQFIADTARKPPLQGWEEARQSVRQATDDGGADSPTLLNYQAHI